MMIGGSVFLGIMLAPAYHAMQLWSLGRERCSTVLVRGEGRLCAVGSNVPQKKCKNSEFD
jgi:hypothetical protein